MNEPGRQKTAWMTSLWQSKAIGWVAFGLLIAVVVAATLMFGGGPEKVAGDASQATQPQGTSR